MVGPNWTKQLEMISSTPAKTEEGLKEGKQTRCCNAFQT